MIILLEISAISMIKFHFILNFKASLLVIVLDKMTSHRLFATITKLLCKHFRQVIKKATECAFVFIFIFDIKCIFLFLRTTTHWINLAFDIVLINFLLYLIRSCLGICNSKCINWIIRVLVVLLKRNSLICISVCCVAHITSRGLSH